MRRQKPRFETGYCVTDVKIGYQRQLITGRYWQCTVRPARRRTFLNSPAMTSKVVQDEDKPTECWPDKEFMESALREWLKEPKLQLNEFTSRIATNKGDNYCSDMYRVVVKCQQRPDLLIFIIKRLKSTAGPKTNETTTSTLFDREVKMLSIALPDMHALLKKVMPDAEPFGAYFVYATPGVVMMEDLLQGGFRMAPRHLGLDLDHCSLVLRTLARYHATSVLLMEHKTLDLSVFRRSVFGDAHGKDRKEKLFTGMLRALAEELKTLDGLEKYSVKISALSDRNMLTLLQKSLDEHEADDFLVLSHGDLWVNNIMFRYSSTGKPDGIRFVDLQLTSITSPCNDLQYFLTASANETVRENATEQLLQEYHDCLCKTMEMLKCSTRPPTFEKLRKDFNKRTYNGMFAAFNVLPIVLSQPGQFDLQNVAETGKPQNALFRNSSYKKALEWFLPLYERNGFL